MVADIAEIAEIGELGNLTSQMLNAYMRADGAMLLAKLIFRASKIGFYRPPEIWMMNDMLDVGGSQPDFYICPKGNPNRIIQLVVRYRPEGIDVDEFKEVLRHFPRAEMLVFNSIGPHYIRVLKCDCDIAQAESALSSDLPWGISEVAIRECETILKTYHRLALLEDEKIRLGIKKHG